MSYAIIETSKELVEPIELSKWGSHEWSQFTVLRTKKTDGNILWFLNEEEAVSFLHQHFENHQISPEYRNIKYFGPNKEFFFK